MAEKRGMTTRYGGERPAKRHQPTPPPEKTTPVKQKRTPVKEKRTPPQPKPTDEVVERPLPTRVVETKPLPTLRTPQPSNLSDAEYQSLRKSGVLAASLERSRQKWLTEGIFERYWTKPTRRKQQGVDMDKNPAKSTMSILGHGKLTLEPHIFEIVLYGVKEPATAAAPAVQNLGVNRPIIQYGPPVSAPTAHQPVPNPGVTQAHPQHPPPSVQNGPQPPKVNGSNPSQTPAPPQLKEPSVQSRPPLAPASSFSGQPSRTHAPHSNPHVPRPGAPPSQAPAQSPDPVIHMLAQRAGHDPELKAIMKIVAAGDANPQQLQFFQRHIDELTAVLQSRSAASQPANPVQRPTANTSSLSAPVPVVARTTGSPSDGTSTPPVAGIRQPYPYQLPQPLRARGTATPTRPDFSAVVFEFAAGSSDRFLFPKHSIVEFLPGNRQVLASFLAVRKGTRGESGTYDPQREYYQPITVRLSTDDPRVLAPLARVIAPPEEVRKYMNEIIDRGVRADSVYLALRLPIRSENGDGEDEQGGAGSPGGTPSTMTVPVVREKRKYTRRVKAA